MLLAAAPPPCQPAWPHAGSRLLQAGHSRRFRKADAIALERGFDLLLRLPAGNDAEGGEPLLHLRRADELRDRFPKLVDDGVRRLRWCEEAVPGLEHEVRHGLGNGGQVRRRGNPRRRSDGQQSYPGEVGGEQDAGIAEVEVDVACQQFGNGLRLPTCGDHAELDADALEQQQRRQMADVVGAGDREVELALVGLRVRDEFRQGIDRQAGPDRHDLHTGADVGDRRQHLVEIERDLLDLRGQQHQDVGREQQRVPIGVRLADLAAGDDAAGTRPVYDDEII